MVISSVGMVGRGVLVCVSSILRNMVNVLYLVIRGNRLCMVRRVWWVGGKVFVKLLYFGVV